jgi:hypothetical protein
MVLFSYRLFSVAFVFSQTKVNLLKSKLKIGEQTELVYEITYSEKEGQLSFIPHQATIPCLIILENSTLNTEKISNLEIIGEFKDSLYKLKKNLFGLVNIKLHLGIQEILLFLKLQFLRKIPYMNLMKFLFMSLVQNCKKEKKYTILKNNLLRCQKIIFQSLKLIGICF